MNSVVLHWNEQGTVRAIACMETIGSGGILWSAVVNFCPKAEVGRSSLEKMYETGTKLPESVAKAIFPGIVGLPGVEYNP